MTETTSVRQEMHRRIDLMPKRELLRLQKITAALDDPDELTPSEKKTIKHDLERFKDHPEEFVSWSAIRQVQSTRS